MIMELKHAMMMDNKRQLRQSTVLVTMHSLGCGPRARETEVGTTLFVRSGKERNCEL